MILFFLFPKTISIRKYNSQLLIHYCELQTPNGCHHPTYTKKRDEGIGCLHHLFIIFHVENHDMFFPTDELSQLGIVGMFPGATRAWKLNTYGLSREKIDYLSDAFKEIAVKYNLNVD